MSYLRVIPRDLFNESDLLKCYGRLVITLENVRDHGAQLIDDSCGPFDIQQDQGSGAIYVANLSFYVHRQAFRLTRPLNSREPWPLWLEGDDDSDFDSVRVFTEEGELSAEFLAFIAKPKADLAAICEEIDADGEPPLCRLCGKHYEPLTCEEAQRLARK